MDHEIYGASSGRPTGAPRSGRRSIGDGEWSETSRYAARRGDLAMLANVYLHYVFDLWVEAWRKKAAQGDMIVVRYADDLCGRIHRAEAERS